MPAPELNSDHLTPMLDVVLNLLMFFIVTATFVTEQVDRDIQLPVAESALIPDRDERDVLFLNVNREGKVTVFGEPEPMNLILIGDYLGKAYDRLKLLSKDEEVRTTVVLRADQNTDYGEVYQLMRMCKDIGFKKLSLRAEIKD
jgi:biopolymer transport protein ExbD